MGWIASPSARNDAAARRVREERKHEAKRGAAPTVWIASLRSQRFALGAQRFAKVLTLLNTA
jgi:hypothetical protein